MKLMDGNRAKICQGCDTPSITKLLKESCKTVQPVQGKKDKHTSQLTDKIT